MTDRRKNNISPPNLTRELEMMNINLSRNKGAIKIPALIPKIIPKTLHKNILNITGKELKKICDLWKISRRGKTKISELQNAIRIHFDVADKNSPVRKKKLCVANVSCTDVQDKPSNKSSLKKYKLGELFAGTGGFSHAFESTGEVSSIFANDKEKTCQPLFKANFPNSLLIIKDINDYDITNIPDIDILTFGSPCQSFSIAGERKGFKDPRGNVFWRIIEILKLKMPKVFVMENVKNLKTHNNGKTFRTMLEHFEKLNYTTSYKVLNTCKYTKIPQNRERIFVVGFQKSHHSEHFKFPNPLESGSMTPLCDFLNLSEALPKFYYKDSLKVWDMVNSNVTKHIRTNTLYQYRRTKVRENMNNVCPTLTANMGGGGHNVPILKDDFGIRKLTPKECFKLQGFPDSMVIPLSLSDSALYKMAGNAITVEVVKLIAVEVIRVLELNEDELKIAKNEEKILKETHINEKMVNEKYELSKSEIRQLFMSYKFYCLQIKKIYKNKNKKTRLPNFPSDISENIIRQYILQKECVKCVWNTKYGDLKKILEKKTLVIEVKTFASEGPTSFGPTEHWDEIYFLDATEFMDGDIKIFRLSVSDLSESFRNVQINKKQTYGDQCLEKRRPRICFKYLKKQLNDNPNFKKVYDGKISSLLD